MHQLCVCQKQSCGPTADAHFVYINIAYVRAFATKFSTVTLKVRSHGGSLMRPATFSV